MVRKTEENVIQRKKIEKHSACIVCTEKDRRKCDSKKKFEKHSACIVCSEKMAMECRQVSTGEHEGER
jgi:tetraacyldisaccharide-1-P 4'-kinase